MGTVRKNLTSKNRRFILPYLYILNMHALCVNKETVKESGISGIIHTVVTIAHFVRIVFCIAFRMLRV